MPKIIYKQHTNDFNCYHSTPFILLVLYFTSKTRQTLSQYLIIHFFKFLYICGKDVLTDYWINLECN